MTNEQDLGALMQRGVLVLSPGQEMRGTEGCRNILRLSLNDSSRQHLEMMENDVYCLSVCVCAVYHFCGQ